MTREESLNKVLYKTSLLLLKIIPILCVIGYNLNTLLAFLNIDAPVLSYLCGLSLFPWVFVLISSFVFKFCVYHRMFLYYILTVNIIDLIDYHYGIPITNRHLMALHLILIGITLFVVLYLYVKISKKAVKQNN